MRFAFTEDQIEFRDAVRDLLANECPHDLHVGPEDRLQARRVGFVQVLVEQVHELGDVLAWLASLAAQLGLSLEDAAQRYVDDPPV